MTGFIGKPVISRGNRSFENYFINGRYVKSSLISKAIEDAYRGFLMQHKYPFTVLHFTIDSKLLDVNVHPTKMELRFANQQEVYSFVQQAVRDSLMGRDLIPEVTFAETKKEEEKPREPEKTREPEKLREPEKPREPEKTREPATPQEYNLAYFMEQMKQRVKKEFEAVKEPDIAFNRELELLAQTRQVREEAAYGEKREAAKEEPQQLELFETHLLNPAARSEIQIIGQLFETYWLVQLEDKFYMIDQHAAHEKVFYERMLCDLKKKEITSQVVSPPLILTLTMQEAQRLSEYLPSFEELGFEIEPFGGKEYALSAVPCNLFGIAEKELFLEILDGLEKVGGGSSQLILEKLASMSCKAAVKGSHRMSEAEAKALIEELFTLENPYNCPHGRPTIISMTKQEIERKFKRIV